MLSIYPTLSFYRGFPGGSEVKASACSAGDLGSIPGSGRSPGEGNDNPLQYSCLENPMDGGAWWAVVHGIPKSWTRLSDFTFTFLLQGQGPQVHSLYLCLYFCAVNGFISTSFLDSIYIWIYEYSFSLSDTSLCVTGSRLIHITTTDSISFLFMAE